MRGGVIWLVAVAAVFALFAILAPHGLRESLWGQVSRPIQVEDHVREPERLRLAPLGRGILVSWLRGADDRSRVCVPRRGLDRVCAGRGRARTVRALRSSLRLRLRRLREGALAAVPDSASSRSWRRLRASRHRGRGATRRGDDRDAVLVRRSAVPGYVEHHFHAPLVLLRNLILVVLCVCGAAESARSGPPIPPGDAS